jgi:hypothetical protein
MGAVKVSALRGIVMSLFAMRAPGVGAMESRTTGQPCAMVRLDDIDRNSEQEKNLAMILRCEHLHSRRDRWAGNLLGQF